LVVVKNSLQFCRAVSTPKPQPYARGGSKTVGRWLKDRKEKRKEETRAYNAQVHAAVSVAAVAAAVAAVAAATAAASSSGKDGRGACTDMAVASAATLVAAQCVEAAEALGADREHLAAAVGSAVNVRTPGDVATVTAAAATGLFPIELAQHSDRSLAVESNLRVSDATAWRRFFFFLV
jgi:hypothetical protein